MKKTIYIAGKMRGVPYYNFPAFDAARDRLAALGFEVISPADMDRAAGFDPWIWASSNDEVLGSGPDWGRLPAGFDLPAALARDNGAIARSDAVLILLNGAGSSEGAAGEILLALRLRKRIVTDDMSDGEILRAVGGPSAAEPALPGRFSWNRPAESNGWVEVLCGDTEVCMCYSPDGIRHAEMIVRALNKVYGTPEGAAPCLEETPPEDTPCRSAKTST